MLIIGLLPRYLLFKNLTVEQVEQFSETYHLIFKKGYKGYKVEGEPVYLYRVLYKLSIDYDIEIV